MGYLFVEEQEWVRIPLSGLPDIVYWQHGKMSTVNPYLLRQSSKDAVG